MAQHVLKRTVFIILGMAALVVAIAVYYVFDPASSHLFPKCPFRLLTDYACPGCGSQRAIHSLLHLDIVGAFRHNAFLVITLPYTAVVIVAAMTRLKWNGFYRRVNNRYAILAFGIGAMVWWVVRNICDW